MKDTVYSTTNFNASEFKCPCGECVNLVRPMLLDCLQLVRDEVVMPLKITSGYRCAKRNKQVGGAKDSVHMEGLAADIFCPYPKDKYTLVAALFQCGFKGIGVYDIHVHADIKNRATPVLWIGKSSINC